jgi:hypothetical protein
MSSGDLFFGAIAGNRRLAPRVHASLRGDVSVVRRRNYATA